MSSRYYWTSALIVIALTLIIGFVTERKSGKELAIIFTQVICGLIAVVGFIVGLAKLLVVFGIAEEGFIL